MYNHRILIALLAVGAVACALSAPAQDAAKEAEAAVPALVVVNGKALTAADLDKRIATRMARFEGMPEESRPQVQAQLREMIQEEFITRTLLTEEAERLKVAVEESEIDAMLEEAKKNLPPGMTLKDILQMEQLDEAGLREEIRQQLTMKKVIETAVASGAKPTDEEIEAFYGENLDKMQMPETVKARHILISVGKDADQAEKKAKADEAEAIRKQLDDGADFAALAKEKSACPSAQSGGDLGVFPRGQMVKPFEDAAFSQEVGKVGDVVETEFGYHIILVDEHNQAKKRTLDETREEIAQYLASRDMGEARQGYLEELRNKATVEYPPEN